MKQIQAGNIAAVVLAAGMGTRMKSRVPKVLHELLGVPLLGHVIMLLDELHLRRMVAVIGHGAEAVSDYLARFAVDTVIQEQQLGTGHAVACARDILGGFHGDILIICGDTPLFLSETLRRFLEQHIAFSNIVSVLSASFPDPAGYGRIVRHGSNSSFSGIVEEKDADEAQREIREVNTGTYLVKADFLFHALSRLDNDNAQGEFYLTDIVSMAVAAGHSVAAYCLASHHEALGVNSRLQLSRAEQIFLDRIRMEHMRQGVTFQNAHTVYVEPSVIMARDVVIQPSVVLKGHTIIGEGADIGAFSYLHDAEIEPGRQVPPFSCLGSGVRRAEELHGD